MLSVILVNWNGWADTIACIQSLLRAESTEFRIIIVDNASPNGSFDIFRKWAEGKLCLIEDALTPSIKPLERFVNAHNSVFVDFDDDTQNFIFQHEAVTTTLSDITSVYFIKGCKNGGFGYGCNVGMKLSQRLGTDSIWLLNNDCVVSSNSVLKLNDYIARNPSEIVGTYIKYYYQPSQFQAVGGGSLTRLTGKLKLHNSPLDHGKLDYIHGASIAFSSVCLEEVGFFDENIFMYCEEVDFCLRAASARYRCMVLPIEIFHKEGASQVGGSSVNAWTQVLISKHYVLKKNFGWGCWVCFFFVMLVMRSLIPFGSHNARIGARRALTHFLLARKL